MREQPRPQPPGRRKLEVTVFAHTANKEGFAIPESLRHWGLMWLGLYHTVHTHSGLHPLCTLSRKGGKFSVSFWLPCPSLFTGCFYVQRFGIRRGGPWTSFTGCCEWLQNSVGWCPLPLRRRRTVPQCYFGWSCGVPRQDEPGVGMEGGKS